MAEASVSEHSNPAVETNVRMLRRANDFPLATRRSNVRTGEESRMNKLEKLNIIFFSKLLFQIRVGGNMGSMDVLQENPSVGRHMSHDLREAILAVLWT